MHCRGMFDLMSLQYVSYLKSKERTGRPGHRTSLTTSEVELMRIEGKFFFPAWRLSAALPSQDTGSRRELHGGFSQSICCRGSRRAKAVGGIVIVVVITATARQAHKNAVALLQKVVPAKSE